MNKKLLADFTKYCKKYPEQRFWQALRNWCGADFIMFNKLDRTTGEEICLDTFYWKGKNR